MCHVLFSRLCNVTVSPCFRSSAKAASRSGINGAMTPARTLSIMLVWPRMRTNTVKTAQWPLQWLGVHDEPFWRGSDEVKRVTGFLLPFPHSLHNLTFGRWLLLDEEAMHLPKRCT